MKPQVLRMERHVTEAAAFLTQMIVYCNGPETIPDPKGLYVCLTELLTQKIKDHWYPDNPQRGQAYRCVILDKTTQVLDPLLTVALVLNNIKFPYVNWPEDMTLWIDPDEVVYTILPRGQHPRNRIRHQIYSIHASYPTSQGANRPFRSPSQRPLTPKRPAHSPDHSPSAPKRQWHHPAQSQAKNNPTTLSTDSAPESGKNKGRRRRNRRRNTEVTSGPSTNKYRWSRPPNPTMVTT